MTKLLKNLNEKIFERITLSISFIYLIVISLGKFNRYIISEQLALAINLEKFGTLYSTTNMENIIHFSSYFPGIAYLLYFIRKIVPDLFLYEFVLILASFTIISFFFVLKNIVKSIYGNKVNLENYWLIVVIFTLFLCDKWIFYAAQFKGDTLAFTLIISGFVISKIYLKNYLINYWKLLLSFILILLGISIKQQAIFIVPALIIFSALNKNLLFKIYSLLLVISIFILYISFYNNENIWFHNITKYSPVAFYSLNNFFKIYFSDLILISIFVLLIYFFNKKKVCKINFVKKINFFKKEKINNFWIYVLVLFSSTGFISSLQVGGNSGNSQLALILIFPILYYFIFDFKKKYLIIFSLVLLILESKNFLRNGYYYLEAKSFQKEVAMIVNKDNNLKILSDKSTYFSLFNHEKNNQIFSLNTFRILNKFLTKKTTDNLLIETVLKNNYDLIVINNKVVDDSKVISKKYKLVEVNKFGKIYKKKTK